MEEVIVHLQVDDYDKWLEGFNAGKDERIATGWIQSRIYQSHEKPKEIIVIHEWESKEKFEEFLSSRALEKGLKLAGVQQMDVFWMSFSQFKDQ